MVEGPCWDFCTNGRLRFRWYQRYPWWQYRHRSNGTCNVCIRISFLDFMIKFKFYCVCASHAQKREQASLVQRTSSDPLYYKQDTFYSSCNLSIPSLSTYFTSSWSSNVPRDKISHKGSTKSDRTQ